MNICHDESPIVTFRDPWGAEDGPSDARVPADEHSREYCRIREAAERAAAKKASSIQAQRIHQELAQAYALRANGREPKC